MIDVWLERWNLTLDGEPFVSPWSTVVPVRYLGTPAMLKIATDIDESKGGELMAWWDGKGAARVYEIDGDAILMERLIGPRSLADKVRRGKDDEATRILCDVASRLHAPREKPLPALTNLESWFVALFRVASVQGGAVANAAAIARKLIDTEEDRSVLHGDLHHGNVLDSGARGWLAIDPKHLFGERAFDFVNILRNPDIPTSLIPGRFERQVNVIVETTDVERVRFLMWVVAFTGLSAAWFIEAGEEPVSDLAINALAVGMLETELR